MTPRNRNGIWQGFDTAKPMADMSNINSSKSKKKKK